MWFVVVCVCRLFVGCCLLFGMCCCLSFVVDRVMFVVSRCCMFVVCCCSLFVVCRSLFVVRCGVVVVVWVVAVSLLLCVVVCDDSLRGCRRRVFFCLLYVVVSCVLVVNWLLFVDFDRVVRGFLLCCMLLLCECLLLSFVVDWCS